MLNLPAALPETGHPVSAPDSLRALFSGALRLNYTTKEAIALLNSHQLFKRMRFHGWLKPLIPNSRDALYPLSNILAVQKRLELGELPPPLPSEIRDRQLRTAARIHRLKCSAKAAGR